MLIRGPFSIQWGQNIIADVEELNIEHEIASDEVETIQGKTYELDGAYKVSCVLTLLASDIPALAVLLPQHFKANGETLSTGQTVTDADGAIDLVAGNDANVVKANLDIMSAANPATICRITEARTKIEGVEIDNKIQKVMIKFVGEAGADEATMQFFKENGITPTS